MAGAGSDLLVSCSEGDLRMAVLAEPLSSREAYDAGLVSHLVADDGLVATGEDVVRRLAAGPRRP